MANSVDKLKYYYTLGGIKLIAQITSDKLKGINQTKERIYQYNLRADPKDYPKIIKAWYRYKKGIDLNIDHPVTFNEKIQWMKIYDVNPLRTKLADKLNVREWVSCKIGDSYLIPLLGVWDSFDQINFSKLPNKFVLKANHGSAWNIIVNDKSAFDIVNAKNKFNDWMSKNYAFVSCFEMQYLNIYPQIIAEAFIESDGGSLTDYKFHCFNGEPQIIEVIGERIQGTHLGKEAVMTPEWIRHPGKSLITMQEFNEDPPIPINYDEMISIVKKLSKDFNYVRVDLYNVKGNIKFGEMTFTPTSGMDPTDEYFSYADLIHLPSFSNQS